MTSLGMILVVLTVLAVIAALPLWRHSRGWGYLPSCSFGLALIIVVIVFVAGHI